MFVHMNVPEHVHMCAVYMGVSVFMCVLCASVFVCAV